MSQSPLASIIAHVALPVPLYKGFDYLVPHDIDYSTLSPGMRVSVPFGPRTVCGIILELRDTSDVDIGKLKTIYTAFNNESAPFNAQTFKLLAWAASYYSHPIGEVFYNALPASLKKPQPRPTYTKTLWKRSHKVFEGRANASKQKAALDAIAKAKNGLWEDALKLMGFTSALLKKLAEQGYLEAHQSDAQTRAMQLREDTTSYTLNEHQQSALKSITSTPDGFKAYLLEGITGSGKTEVYIGAVQNIISSHQQALVLVPEINLTPQTLKRFQSQLGHPIAVYHSGMSNKEKLIAHTLASSGQAQVVIGTRSSVFLPFKDLGLIIVDEEHDSSYKQSDGFKYSARDLAVKRAQNENCTIVLGSATPSSDSFMNALNGRFEWLQLRERANKATLPSINLEDMRALTSKDIFSPRTLAQIKAELDQGNQTIIFHNRRGLAPSLMCFDCGTICECPNCDARMTVHSKPARLHCHHCDHKQAILSSCSQCQSTNVHALGAGTERLENILAFYFPNTPIARLDRDQIKSQQDLEAVSGQILSGTAGLIVGTQMIAKGHDFPDVTLVVVIDADGLFFSSDFRAMEKGAQQLLQVAGRAGRGDKKGRVIIQTRQPEHPLFDKLRKHDYRQFMQDELRERELCALPPFSKLMSIRSEAPSLMQAEQILLQLKSYLVTQNELTSAFIAGPIAASITRKQNHYRYYLHFFGESPKQRYIAQQFAQHFIGSVKDKKLRISIDIDPIETV